MSVTNFTPANRMKADAVLLALKTRGCPSCGIIAQREPTEPYHAVYRVTQWLHFPCGTDVKIEELDGPRQIMTVDVTQGCRISTADAMAKIVVSASAPPVAPVGPAPAGDVPGEAQTQSAMPAQADGDWHGQHSVNGKNRFDEPRRQWCTKDEFAKRYPPEAPKPNPMIVAGRARAKTCRSDLCTNGCMNWHAPHACWVKHDETTGMPIEREGSR